MSTPQTKSGFVNIDRAQIYYETAGKGTSFVMIHAGVADSRQWNNEFAFFARNHQVLRYDMRGYGKSEPVDGEFSHISDLVSVLNTLELQEPLVMMGCSMGGGLAMDFALASIENESLNYGWLRTQWLEIGRAHISQICRSGEGF